jgi:hypothetical protein
MRLLRGGQSCCRAFKLFSHLLANDTKLFVPSQWKIMEK